MGYKKCSKQKDHRVQQSRGKKNRYLQRIENSSLGVSICKGPVGSEGRRCRVEREEWQEMRLER